MRSNITFLKTKKYDYIYDGNTGNILRVHPVVKKILTEYFEVEEKEMVCKLQKEYSKKEIDKGMQQIAFAIEKGLLAERPKAIYTDGILKQIPYSLENSLGGVCLAVTQQCNLRCKYCTYSGIYGNQNRFHSDQIMSFETAKKAIDYTIARSTNRDEYHISFYGGEPLIGFDLIKDCINYVTSKYPGKRYDFNITTNGTLLTEEKLDFLVKHMVRVYISIDGPEEYHDEYRVYSNQKGSFRDIKQNLLCIKDKYPKYYHEKVHFGVTISPFRSLQQIEDFIAEDEIFHKNCYIRVSSVNGGIEDDIYKKKRTEEAIREQFIDDVFINLRYLVSKTRGDDDYLHRTRVAKEFCDSVNVINDRRKVVASERVLPGGPCLPGARLFVNTNGDFVICEKANEASECLKFGNVDDGLDVEKARKIIEDYFELTEKECLSCWAYLNCSICPVQIEGDEELSRSKKLQQCEWVKTHLYHELVLYLAILEKNPLAFGAI